MFNGIKNGNEKSIKQNILYYLRNSKIEHFSKGSYGIIKKSILDESKCQYQEFQPFLSLDANIDVIKNKRSKKCTRVEQYKIPIKSLMIKICVINKDDMPFPSKLPKKSYHINNPNYNEKNEEKSKYIHFVDESEFIMEVNTQTDIYLKTIKYLQPICPAILYSTIITDTRHKEYDYLDNSFYEDQCQGQVENEDQDQEILELLDLPKFITEKDVTYGLIFMEYLEEYSPFEKFTIPTFKSKKSFVLVLLWTLIQLTLETGYVHGDHHMNNILITNKYPKGGYFDSSTIRIMIIDFGMSSKLLPNHFKMFKALCERRRYTDALMFLSGKYKDKQENVIYVTNEYVSNYVKHKNIYGWACGSYNGKVCEKDQINDLFKEKNVQSTNQVIHNIFALREIALNNNISTFYRLNKALPTHYPLLPLSNNVKNYLYNGFYDIKKLDDKVVVKYVKIYKMNDSVIWQNKEETMMDDEDCYGNTNVTTFLDWNFAAVDCVL